VTGQRIGYARVSTSGQSLEVQLDKLSDCDRIFKEKASGAKANNRQELNRALDFVREGDIFVVTKLDRLARSVADLSNIAYTLSEKKVDLVVLDQAIDTTSPMGRLVFHMMGAIGEFERELIRERAHEGRQKARANGVRFGPKPKLSESDIESLRDDFASWQGSKADLAQKYGISKASLYRLAKNQEERQEGKTS